MMVAFFLPEPAFCVNPLTVRFGHPARNRTLFCVGENFLEFRMYNALAKEDYEPFD